jgi:alcohol dehydrogenase class IV
VICSGSLARNTDSLQRLTAALGPDKIAGQRIGMKPHTQWSEVLEIVADARKVQADLLLTLGAGSLTDGAKIVAFALANNANTADELEALAEGPKKRTDIVSSTIPIISVPTSLSAGEYSDYAGGTEDKSHRKYMFYPPLRGPELVILDPKLVETTPDSIWLSTGVRAVDHCVETLCAVGVTTSESDDLARNALGRLVPGLLRCKKNRADHDASLQCQLGSVDAMAACTLISFKLGASHGIGHQVHHTFYSCAFLC